MVKTFKIKEHEIQIDDIDADILELSWYTRVTRGSRTVYVARSVSQRPNPIPRTVLMHRMILERVLGRPLERGENVDHIDLNGLNNTRANLRIATSSQNLANTRVRRDSQTGVKGVGKSKNRYVATIRVNSKAIHLGQFPTIEEAHAAYVAAAKKYFGEFARGE